MKNIVLVGFMGTGKTSIARELSAKLGMEFIDMDDVIEERTGLSIPEIFDSKGEEYFRQIERGLVKELCQRQGLVIAAGGGVVINEKNLNDILGSSITICLDAKPQDIISRTSGHAHRPLLNVDDPHSKIKELLEKRKKFYDKVPDHIDTSGITQKEALDRTMEIIRKKITCNG